MSPAYKRQLPTAVPSGFTGTLTVSTNTLPTSLVLDNGVSESSLGSLAPTITITVPTTENPSPTSTGDASNATDTVAVSSASKSSVPIGSVIGICVGVFAALGLAIYFMFRLSANTRKLRAMTQRKRRSTMVDGRNSRQDMERRKSGREMWMKMDESDSKEKGSASKGLPTFLQSDDTTTSRANGGVDAKATVERSVTMKSSKTFKSLYGAGLGFANSFRTNDPPPQLEFTDNDLGSGSGFSRTNAPFAHETNADSWDGSTVADDSFLSLKHASISTGVVSGSLSPSIVQTHQTPPATQSKLHRWEEAEVVSPSAIEPYDSTKPRHPYAIASPIITQTPTITGENPFLDQNPFEDTPGSSTQPSDSTFVSSASIYSEYPSPVTPSSVELDNQQNALASLIAALDITPEEAKNRLSMHLATPPLSALSYGSKYSDASGVSGIDKFPMPPPASKSS